MNAAELHKRLQLAREALASNDHVMRTADVFTILQLLNDVEKLVDEMAVKGERKVVLK